MEVGRVVRLVPSLPAPGLLLSPWAGGGLPRPGALRQLTVHAARTGVRVAADNIKLFTDVTQNKRHSCGQTAVVVVVVGSGVLVFWCSGVLVFWCSGVLVFWCSGVLVFWCSGVLVLVVGNAHGSPCRRVSLLHKFSLMACRSFWQYHDRVHTNFVELRAARRNGVWFVCALPSGWEWRRKGGCHLPPQSGRKLVSMGYVTISKTCVLPQSVVWRRRGRDQTRIVWDKLFGRDLWVP